MDRTERLALLAFSWTLGLVPPATGQGAPPRESPERGVEEECAESPPPTIPFTLEGFVLGTDGSPAEGAVVVSGAGGRAVTDATGRFRLEVQAASDAEAVQITAVGPVGTNQQASTHVALEGSPGLVRVAPLSLRVGATCQPGWQPTFGARPGTNSDVEALAVFDDGGGPALYAAGLFSYAGNVAASRIVRWSGSSWKPLGSGLSGDGEALAVYDGGSGPALYVGGQFTTAGGVSANNVARWNGSSWTALGSGTNGKVEALAVYDDGSGPALFVGGTFTTAGGGPANRVAKWNGASWSALGSGTNGGVTGLVAHDDGSGLALYAVGTFTSAGGLPASRIARWDGSGWSALGTGVNNTVQSVAVYDSGGGAALHVGGSFTNAGGVPANRIARWNGASWSALGSGMTGPSDSVNSLAVYDSGSGPALYAGGSFATAGGVTAGRIARWNGSSWSSLGLGIGLSGTLANCDALAVFDDGSGPALFAGGPFSGAGGVVTSRVAKWDGAAWGALDRSVDNVVQALASHDDGSGPALYAGGLFNGAGGVAPGRVLKWEGSSWAPLEGALGSVHALATLDTGSSEVLYAGGQLQVSGSQGVARWNGASWSSVPGLFDRFADEFDAVIVKALCVHDDGGGPALFAGGYLSLDGSQLQYIAKRVGSSWVSLAGGMNGRVEAIVVHDDGSGPALYAGGVFTTAGGVPANRVARWNGSSWSALGSGIGGGVYALASFDDGSGPALYAGGVFTLAGGVAVNHVARWDGSGWSALASGLGGSPSPEVKAMVVHDDGSGLALYVGGEFTTVGGVAANRIARWDGSSWSALGGGMSTGTSSLPFTDAIPVMALAVHDDGDGPALFAGGHFTTAFDSGDSFLAKWGCPDSTPPVLSCPAEVLALDALSGPPGEVVLYSVSATDDVDPAPTVVCVPPSGSFFPRGTTLVTCTATDATGNESSCQFPVTVRIKARRR